ncbi:MAG TPA: PadR family transcriptional regulator [Acidimicrobiales bacterium]|nr:PadR family transcriptional regulator [Acidimicrobiales bacterium]
MSLRHGLLSLLAGQPMSGYDLARFFSVSMGNVWPAQHGQIYPELAKLASEGLITQTGDGPRGRKTYETTEAGFQALRVWAQKAETDYSVRYEPLLRVFCMWSLSPDEAVACLQADREEYRRHLENLEGVVATRDWSANGTARSARLAIEFGRRFYSMQVAWADWAIGQVRAGILDDGGPVPPVTSLADWS